MKQVTTHSLNLSKSRHYKSAAPAGGTKSGTAKSPAPPEQLRLYLLRLTKRGGRKHRFIALRLRSLRDSKTLADQLEP